MKQKKLMVMCNDENVGDLLKFALNFELPAGEVPTEVMLVPPGTVVKGRDGREYLNNDPAAIITWFANREVDLTFDWLHATELKAPKGDEAPASGWGKFGTMAAKADGSVWINVEWTPRGAEAIKNREYRYISPVYLCDATMAIRGISSVGLTNKPNVFIPALNGEQTPSNGKTGGSKMTYEEFLKACALACGLPATATPEECIAACKEMASKMTTAMNFEKNPPPLTLFVPRADFDNLMTRCTNAEKAITDAGADRLKKEANTEIEAALLAKKITPGTRSYYEKQCNTEEGLKEFREFAKAAPVIAGDSNLDDKDPNAGNVQLNAEATQMAAIFGNSAEDLKKYGGV